jgi:hypothetical protein
MSIKLNYLQDGDFGLNRRSRRAFDPDFEPTPRRLAGLFPVHLPNH